MKKVEESLNDKLCSKKIPLPLKNGRKNISNCIKKDMKREIQLSHLQKMPRKTLFVQDLDFNTTLFHSNNFSSVSRAKSVKFNDNNHHHSPENRCFYDPKWLWTIGILDNILLILLIFGVVLSSKSELR